MIIIKTKTGDHFINEKAVTAVHHDREKAVVSWYSDNGYQGHHEDVVEVYYANDVHDTQYRSKGCELEALEKCIDEMKNERSLLFQHFDFMHSLFLVYRDALLKIEASINRGEASADAHKEIIKEAENKYNKLSDSFNKIREKLKKKKLDILQGKQ